MMPGTRFTEFLALSVDPMVGISGLHRRLMTDYFSYLFSEIFEVLKIKRCMTANTEHYLEVFITAHK